MAMPIVMFDKLSQGVPLNYSVDFSEQDFVLSQNLASCAIQIVSGTAAIGAPSVSGKIATASVTANTGTQGGAKIVTIWTATAADGQKFAIEVDFFVKDLTASS